MPPAFRCPSCANPLQESAAGFGCERGHHFDRAREGYVNLIPGGRLRSRPAGDDDRMVKARRAVLDAGLYSPIIEAVATEVSLVRPRFILDAGCGEGSYLGRTAELSAALGWGIDVSKPAVKLAANRHREARFAIASSYTLPFEDETFDAVINVFSPRDFPEMRRVVRAGGVAVVVTPGPHHLAQLKALLYDDPREHAEVAGGQDAAERVSTVRFDLDLTDPAVRSSLLEMTPYWWSATAERRDVVLATALEVTVDVRIALYRFDTSPDVPEQGL